MLTALAYLLVLAMAVWRRSSRPGKKPPGPNDGLISCTGFGFVVLALLSLPLVEEHL